MTRIDRTGCFQAEQIGESHPRQPGSPRLQEAAPRDAMAMAHRNLHVADIQHETFSKISNNKQQEPTNANGFCYLYFGSYTVYVTLFETSMNRLLTNSPCGFLR